MYLAVAMICDIDIFSKIFDNTPIFLTIVIKQQRRNNVLLYFTHIHIFTHIHTQEYEEEQDMAIAEAAWEVKCMEYYYT